MQQQPKYGRYLDPLQGRHGRLCYCSRATSTHQLCAEAPQIVYNRYRPWLLELYGWIRRAVRGVQSVWRGCVLAHLLPRCYRAKAAAPTCDRLKSRRAKVLDNRHPNGQTQHQCFTTYALALSPHTRSPGNTAVYISQRWKDARSQPLYTMRVDLLHK